jgi:dihydroflavonol-4-reductase
MDDAKEGVTVFGATGFLGSHVAEALVEEGYRVVAPARPATRMKRSTHTGIEWADWDGGAESAGQFVMNQGIVINCIAVGQDSGRKEYEQVEVELTRRIIEAASKAVARGYIQLSSIVAYGSGPWERPVTESTPKWPRALIDRMSLARELVVVEASRLRGLPFIVIEPVSAIGRRDSASFFFKIRKMLAAGTYPLVGGGRASTSFIDARDVGRAFAFACDRLDELAGGTFLVKGYDSEWLELKNAIDRRNGEVSKAKSIPYALFWGICTLAELFAPKKGLNRRTALMIGKDRLYDDSRFRAFGFRPSYSLKDSIDYALSQDAAILNESGR